MIFAHRVSYCGRMSSSVQCRMLDATFWALHVACCTNAARCCTLHAALHAAMSACCRVSSAPITASPSSHALCRNERYARSACHTHCHVSVGARAWIHVCAYTGARCRYGIRWHWGRARYSAARRHLQGNNRADERKRDRAPRPVQLRMLLAHDDLPKVRHAGATPPILESTLEYGQGGSPQVARRLPARRHRPARQRRM